MKNQIKIIAVFIIALFSHSAASAQVALDLCPRLEKIINAFSGATAAAEATGMLAGEQPGYDIYESKYTLRPMGSANVYTLPEKVPLIGFDEMLSNYDNDSITAKEFSAYYTQLNSCFGVTMQDRVNPDPKPGEALRLAEHRVSDLLVLKLYHMQRQDETASATGDEKKHYLFLTLGLEE